MAHYALLNENNVVVNVIKGRDENETIEGISNWEQYYGEFYNATCKRTSYNSAGGKRINPETNETVDQPGYRKNYAGIGFTYDFERDAFIPPKPEGDWVLSEDTCLWEPAI